jgi:hypothetical protein
MALRNTSKVDLNVMSDKAPESRTTSCIITLCRGCFRSFLQR